MGLKTGRTNGAAAYEAARKNGDMLARFGPPAGPVVSMPANGGLGKAAVFHERMNRADDTPAPWDEAEDYAAQHRALGLPTYDEYEWDKVANTYDDTCGMASRQEFAHELLMAVFADVLEMDIEINGWPVVRRGDAYTGQWDSRIIGFNSAAHIYLASLGVHRLHNASRPIVTTPVTPTVLPQDLMDKRDIERDPDAVIRQVAETLSAPASQRQPSASEAVEQAVLARTDADKVKEMAEAVQFAVEHWDNADARRLPDGYQVYRAPGKPSDAHLPENQMGPYIIWRHPRLAGRVVVGMRDLKSGEMCYVATKKDIAEYMGKVGKAVADKTPPFFGRSTTPTTGNVPSGLTQRI